MYVNLFKKRLSSFWDGLFPRGLRRSPLLPVLVVIVLVVLPGIAWYLHTHGRFHVAKAQIQGDTTPSIQTDRPGGADPVVLKRTQGTNEAPEFLSTTLLPGVGMDVLQISAFVPGRGEVSLLMNPTVAEMANNKLPERNGIDDVNGALEAPWSGALAGPISPIGTSLTANWNGATISVPRDPSERAGVADGGLLKNEAADTINISSHDDGSTATAEFRTRDFAGHWPQPVSVGVTVQMSARTIDLTVSARNAGDQPVPVGLGWHPRFVLDTDSRAKAQLELPNGDVMDIADQVRRLPSGRISSPPDRVSRFFGHSAAIGSTPLDVTLVHLKPTAGEPGPAVELRDEANGFGLRMIGLSPGIRAARVESPDDASYIAMGMQTNLDDPFNHAWHGDEGISILQAGDTVQWKVRLEIFALPRK